MVEKTFENTGCSHYFEMSECSSREFSDFVCDNGTLCSLFQADCWNSDDFYLSCLKSERKDDEMNPLEDAIIARMYIFECKTLQEISSYLNRRERAINLRLRLFFDSLACPNVLTHEDKKEICEFFFQRAKKFLSFCSEVILAVNPEHELSLLDPYDDLLNEALSLFLDFPEENHYF